MRVHVLASILEDKKGVTPFLETNYSKVPTGYYENYITKKNFDNANSCVFLELTNFKGGNLVLRDYLDWNLGHPNAYYVVGSPKYNSTLSKLQLPKHRFYNAEIDVEGNTHKYYVLHFIQEYLQDIDFKKSQFAETLLLEKNSIFRLCNTGEIKNEAHYHELNKKLVEEMKYLQPKKIYFRPEINYDIWGLRGQIIISERAKQQIEKDQITGVEMINLKDTEMFKNLEVVFSNPDYKA